MWLVDLAAEALSGETTSVFSGERTYSRAISPMRSCRSPISCTRPWLLEIADGFAHFAARKLLHGFFERRVFLPDDLIHLAVRIPASCNCA